MVLKSEEFDSWLKDALLEGRRPGVLVLVNDCDWELSGQLDTTLEEKDVVVFISTLHGGKYLR
ncbi:hypothetical protein CCACVL1_30848 [Corchorus capsularis]|uniref:Ubiquitin-related modifier 1 n=1 Tax=Corchorus capsularis TaxID=210143 RepID=A0A1R3FV21_COCAP|nr:hypothetical protein CCACVL1_30848 [Corchorus capsularis]